ncbi:MAG: AtpZ/AtpI family protein [Henriciella sp.]
MAENETDDLSERIKRAQAARRSKVKAPTDPVETASVSAGGMALRYGAEMVACIFVGLMAGLYIDEWLGSRPWGLLIFLGFGLAAGVLGVIRAYQQLTAGINPANSADETNKDSKE